MSVDVNDFRKFTSDAQARKDGFVAQAPLALQEPIANEFEVGDDKLDKLSRMVQAVIEQLNPAITDLQTKGMGCVQDDLFRACQLNYVYAKGKLDAYKDVQTYPKRIMQEQGLKSV